MMVAHSNLVGPSRAPHFYFFRKRGNMKTGTKSFREELRDLRQNFCYGCLKLPICLNIEVPGLYYDLGGVYCDKGSLLTGLCLLRELSKEVPYLQFEDAITDKHFEIHFKNKRNVRNRCMQLITERRLNKEQRKIAISILNDIYRISKKFGFKKYEEMSKDSDYFHRVNTIRF